MMCELGDRIVIVDSKVLAESEPPTAELMGIENCNEACGEFSELARTASVSGFTGNTCSFVLMAFAISPPVALETRVALTGSFRVAENITVSLVKEVLG